MASTITGDVRRMTGIADFIVHGLAHIAETKLGEDLDIEPHIRDMLFSDEFEEW
jgi:hypothetical protein